MKNIDLNKNKINYRNIPKFIESLNLWKKNRLKYNENISLYMHNPKNNEYLDFTKSLLDKKTKDCESIILEYFIEKCYEEQVKLKTVNDIIKSQKTDEDSEKLIYDFKENDINQISNNIFEKAIKKVKDFNLKDNNEIEKITNSKNCKKISDKIKENNFKKSIEELKEVFTSKQKEKKSKKLKDLYMDELKNTLNNLLQNKMESKKRIDMKDFDDIHKTYFGDTKSIAKILTIKTLVRDDITKHLNSRINDILRTIKKELEDENSKDSIKILKEMQNLKYENIYIMLENKKKSNSEIKEDSIQKYCLYLHLPLSEKISENLKALIKKKIIETIESKSITGKNIIEISFNNITKKLQKIDIDKNFRSNHPIKRYYDNISIENNINDLKKLPKNDLKKYLNMYQKNLKINYIFDKEKNSKKTIDLDEAEKYEGEKIELNFKMKNKKNKNSTKNLLKKKRKRNQSTKK